MDDLDKYSRDCVEGRTIARLAVAHARNQDEPTGLRLERTYIENIRSNGQKAGWWQELVESL